MEILVPENIISTVCNSLRASKQSLRAQLARVTEEHKKEILEHQLAEVNDALSMFTNLE